MRSKRKKIVYMMFLLITILMFLHSWKFYISPMGVGSSYAKKPDIKAPHLIQSSIYSNTHVVVHA